MYKDTVVVHLVVQHQFLIHFKDIPKKMKRFSLLMKRRMGNKVSIYIYILFLLTIAFVNSEYYIPYFPGTIGVVEENEVDYEVNHDRKEDYEQILFIQDMMLLEDSIRESMTTMEGY